MNSYEAKQQTRRDRLEAAADRAETRANAAYKRADMSEAATGIPFGQPILVGHHSEARHRRAIERADNAMRKSVAEDKRARELRAKAASVGTGGISSDDPEAIAKLQKQIDDAEALQKQMKAANQVVKKWSKKGVGGETEGPDFDAYHAALKVIVPAATEKVAREFITRHMGSVGFAPYQLTNNGANIRRLKARVEQLKKAAARPTREHACSGGVTITENAEENRVQITFPGKPDADTRSVLKSNGFKWAPSQGAWQRKLNNAGIHAARRTIAALGLTIDA
ncbi:DUF3560 domain-containing protein [Paracoccus mangrovi]|uniref:DUF3560 domain-containing protein n=1 Tax=Paracoccus mangrovi TaxID=1715645 RepID=A0ABV7R9N2_9RHOB